MQRLMGLDVGSVTVGVAVSDLLGYTAQPIETIRIDEAKQEYGFDRIAELVKEYNPAKFVLGLPKHMNNDEGVRALASRHYGDLLVERFGIPVAYQDERLTTAQAEKILIQGNTRRENRKKYIDKLAAVLILQNYLDSHSL
ncbi:putative pre-16S rRNA nuclease [Lactococcus hodotermopsidis]|uniref:Putative pre-16S rRNA nuclease n=1 Tax=Pseudolactococcus hodotermopsidis TaxID=2709157 RepID=A0A6A0BE71_9LACT|nr:Holliday junction resolvase RuvX [Lactococcus hodotermopsidis]GFH42985.1 putative pre-16S rRNA nuclease [Lactococcus hodotermopsidis]